MPATDGSIRFEFSPPGHLGPFRAAVSERGGGVSDGPYRSLNVGRTLPDEPARVRENEQRILAALRLPDAVARVRLEHGARILTVGEPGFYGPADALLSDRADLVLWFTVADCFPVTIAAGRWRGHGHCGWRSTAAGLPERLVAALAAASEVPAKGQRAWIGPGIGPCCYPVGEDVAARFPAAMARQDGERRLDLGAEIARRLRAAGLPAAGIAASGRCTSCHPDRFFSHRRDGSPSGRMAALSWPAALASTGRPSSSR